MSDFDLKLDQWRCELEATLAFTPDEIAELEDHIQIVYDKKRAEGNDSESAWNHALMSIGSPNALSLEFTKNKLLPAFWRLLGSWSRALIMLALFSGIGVFSFFFSWLQPQSSEAQTWISPLWETALFGAWVSATFLLILSMIAKPLRRAVIAGVGNSFALIPILYSLTYNSFTEWLVGQGWIHQGVTFDFWQLGLSVAAIIVVNIWWRKQPIARSSMALMVAVVLLLAGIPFINECLCNLSVRVLYDLPDHAPDTAGVLRDTSPHLLPLRANSFINWYFLNILIRSSIFVVNMTPLAIALAAALGIIWAHLSTRETVLSPPPCFPSRESVFKLLVLLASGVAWIFGRFIEPPFSSNFANSVATLSQMSGHPTQVVVGLEPANLVYAFVFLVCQYELSKRLRAAGNIHRFFSWLLVAIELIVAGMLSVALLENTSTSESQEPEWLSFILLGGVVLLTVWQARIIHQKTAPHNRISMWRWEGIDLVRTGLLAGIVITVSSLPLIMPAINCAISSVITIGSALAWGHSMQDLKGSEPFNPEMYLLQPHLQIWLTCSIIIVAWGMALGITFVIILSGLEFIRFNAWRMYKGRLIAKLVKLEKKSGEAPQVAEAD